MPATFTVKCLSDPRKIARHYYVLEPFLNSDFISTCINKEIIKEMMTECIELSRDKRLVGGLKIFRQLHEEIADNTARFKDKKVIFISGLTRISTYSTLEEMDYKPIIGIDPISSLNSLARELAKKTAEAIKNSSILQTIIFFPIAPFIFPFYTDSEKIYLLYEDKMKNITLEFLSYNKKGFGDLERKIEDVYPNNANYQFSPRLYVTEKAKSIYLYDIDVSEIKGKRFDLEQCTFFNRLLLRESLKFFVKRIQPRNNVFIDIYACKTSYQYKIFEKIAKELDLKIFNFYDFRRGQDEKKYALDSELDQGCLRRFGKKMRYIYGDEKRKSRENLL